MKYWWLRTGCFLTGYNYGLLSSCSETAKKVLKKYTAGLMIICIIWFFIGFSFTERYLHGGVWQSLLGAVVACLLVVQIERQIILSTGKNKLLYFFRIVIAVTMALIGSLIVDQLIFKDDIDVEKEILLNAKVDDILPAREKELNAQIQKLDQEIIQKENDRRLLIDDITKNPTITTVSKNKSEVIAPNNGTDSGHSGPNNSTIVKTSINTVQNPKIALLEPLDAQIGHMRKQKQHKDSLKLDLRPEVEKAIKAHVGFLDELKVMWSIITGSGIAAFVWLFWVSLLFCLELVILVAKSGEKPTDYDEIINHQMAIHLKKIQLLSKAGNISVPREVVNN